MQAVHATKPKLGEQSAHGRVPAPGFGPSAEGAPAGLPRYLASAATAMVQRKLADDGTDDHSARQANGSGPRLPDDQGNGDAGESQRRRATSPSSTRGAPDGGYLVGHLGAGERLPESAAAQFSAATGANVSDVRIHLDEPTTASVNATAYTAGHHVAFAPGAWEPDSPGGQRLLFHELAHVVQQRGGLQLAGGIDGGRDDPHEQLADEVADEVMRGEPATRLASWSAPAGAVPSIQREEPEPSPHKVPQPIDIVWGGDPFTVSFAVEIRDSQTMLVVRPRYRGKFPFDAVFPEDFSLMVSLGPQPVNATAQLLGDDQIRVDTYGDGERVYTLRDAWATTEHEIHEGRRHRFALILFGKEAASRVGWVLDPAAIPGAKAAPIAPPKPFSSATAPVFIGGFSAVDVVLGPYGDSFRLTVMARGVLPKSDEKVTAVFGISSLYRGKPRDAAAKEFKFVGVPSIAVLESGTGGLAIDLNGDGKADLVIADTITVPADYDGGGPAETNRNHNVLVTGTEFGSESFFFTVRYGNTVRGGYATPRDIDKLALSNAQAAYSLGEQKKAGTSFEGLVDSYDAAMLSLGQQAAAEKIVDADLVDAWGTLIRAMARVRMEKSTGSVPGDVLVTGANAADRLYGLLEAATKYRDEAVFTMSETSSTQFNPYTGKGTTISGGIWPTVRETPGAAAGVGAALRRADIPRATAGYQALMSGVAAWIATRLREAKGESSDIAIRASAIAGRRKGLGELAGKNARPIPAVFHPDARFAGEPGYVSEVPLTLIAWKDDDTWNLRDLTNPESTYDFDVEDAAAVDPPVSLFAELDDIDHFPAGVVHYEVPDKFGGQVRVRDHMTWKKFFTWLGLGLAAVGLTLATFGTGTVAVAGAWVLAASGLAAATSAGIDLADKASHNALTATTVVIDVAQIVAGLVGVAQVRYGLVVAEATGAAKAGLPWAGTQAAKALGAQQAYLVYTGMRIAADGTTLVVTSVEIIKELNAIESSSASPEEKSRAKMVLLTTLAINGGMFGLMIKGELPKLGGERSLILHYPVKGGPPVANVGGMEAPTGIKFSQKDVSGLTGDKTMTIEELAASMKAGWKGPGIDVVEMPDGTKISLDNRRLLAAQMAGLKEIPVAYHPPNERFPPERNPIDPDTGRAAFELDKPIRRLEDGTLVFGGAKGDIVYPKNYRPANYGEAAMVRSANQGAKFGLSGSFDQPKIRVPKGPAPSAGTE